MSHEPELRPSASSTNLDQLTFGTVVKLSHPLLNMLTRFEGTDHSRLVRVMPWLAQVAVYTVLIIWYGEQW